MVKVSTLTALLLWLTVSVRTSRAGKVESWNEWSTKGLAFSEKDGENDGEKLTDVPMKPWLNLLHGAVVALEANKYQTALTLVNGVDARANELQWTNDDDRDKFKYGVALIEKAVEADDKTKAIALINSLSGEITKTGLHVSGGGGGVQPRGFLEEEDLQRKKKEVADNLRKAFAAIKEDEKRKAEKILKNVYQILKDNKELGKEEKALAFLAAIDETEKYIKEDARGKAEQALRDAAQDVGIKNLPEQDVAAGPSNAETDQKEEQDHDPKVERKKQMLETFLRQAITAIKGEEKAKAEKILTTIYQILKNDKTLGKEQKAIKFLEAIEETEKYVKQDAKDKAEQVPQGAAAGLGLQAVQDQYVRNRKTGASHASAL